MKLFTNLRRFAGRCQASLSETTARHACRGASSLTLRHAACLSLLLTALTAPMAHAADKTGTTLTLNQASVEALSSYKTSSTETVSGFGFMRHKIGPVQVLSSLSSHANQVSGGAGLFAENDNQMSFTSDGRLVIGKSASDVTCLAVVVPKGYVFTGYSWDIDASASSGAAITRYTYNATPGTMDVITTTEPYTAGSSAYANTLTTTDNVLFFRVTGTVTFNAMKFTYVVGDAYEASLIISDGGKTRKVHTGYLNVNRIFLSSTVIDDLQDVKIYTNLESGAWQPQKVAYEGKDYLTIPTYKSTTEPTHVFVEAPAQFRITGATLDVLSPHIKYDKVSAISDNGQYIITDGYGHYLCNSNGQVSLGTDITIATKWTAIEFSNVVNGWGFESDGFYLNLTWTSQSITVGLINSSSTYYASNNMVWVRDDKGFYNNAFYNSLNTKAYLGFSANAGWSLGTSATFNFCKLMTTGEIDENSTFYGGPCVDSPTGTDGQYVITDGNFNYMKYDGDETTTADITVSNTTDINNATEWNVQYDSSYDDYIIMWGNPNDNVDHYVTGFTSGSVGAYRGSSPGTPYSNSYWKKKTANNSGNVSWYGEILGFNSSTYGYTNYYYLNCNGSTWQVSTSAGNAKFQERIATGYPFYYAFYNPDGSAPSSQVLVSAGEAASQQKSGFNNDAVTFVVVATKMDEGFACFNMTLQLRPLNPELTSLSVKADNVENTAATAYTPENFSLSNEAISYKLTTESSSATLHFSSATGEDTEANFFLVAGSADSGTTDATLNATASAEGRKSTDKAGTISLTYADAFTRTAAGYVDAATVSPSDGEKTFYVYVADQPTYNIVPASVGTKHIDYRCYRVTVRAVAAGPVTIDETSADNGTVISGNDGKTVTVMLKRSFSTGDKAQNWQTLVLPFSLTATQVSELFGDARVEAFTGTTPLGDDNYQLLFSPSDGIQANTPVLVNNVTAVGGETYNGTAGWYRIEGVTIEAPTAPASSTGSLSFTPAGASCDFVGFYDNGTLSAGDYYLSSNTFYRVKSSKATKGLRAAFRPAAGSNAKLAGFAIDEGGVVTAITVAPEEGEAADGAAYNLAGQRVTPHYKGVVISGGKKFVNN